MKRKKITQISICMAGMLLLSGCGTQAYVLTDAEESVIVNYAAHVISKHNTYQNAGLRDSEKKEEKIEESIEQPQEESEKAQHTFSDVFDAYGVQISYKGYELAHDFIESNVLDVTAQKGKQYAIFSFEIKNASDTEHTLDIFSANMTFDIEYTVDGQRVQVSDYKTFLTSDLAAFDENTVILAGEEKEAVLLFEIPDTVTEIIEPVLKIGKEKQTYEIKL